MINMINELYIQTPTIHIIHSFPFTLLQIKKELKT